MALKRTVTPARLAANRRSALKSTGPRTALGKSYSALNAMKRGHRSSTFSILSYVLDRAPSGGVRRMARQVMTPGQFAHPKVQSVLRSFWTPGDLDREPEGKFVRKYLRLRPPST